MLSTQSIMWILLGFGLGGLIACLIAPLYGHRAARLAIEVLKQRMPTTQEDFQAHQDITRAQFALQIHDLQTKVRHLSLKVGHQKVEINKRDVHVQDLEKEIADLNASHLEHQNARRVLEVTLTERIPKIEERLYEARKLLDQRETEISALSHSSEKQADALQQATQINAQQRIEIENLKTKLAMRTFRNRETPHEQRSEVEFALRSEIGTLRARLNDQVQTLALLQKKVSEKKDIEGSKNINAEEEMKRLSKILSEAQQAFQENNRNAYSQNNLYQALEEQIAHLKTQNDDQYKTIQDLRAEILVKDTQILHQSSQHQDAIVSQGLTQRLAVVSELWNNNSEESRPKRPTLSELVNTPKSGDTISRETTPRDTVSSANRLLPRNLQENIPSDASDASNLKTIGETDKIQIQKTNQRSSLLQRIRNIEEPLI